MDQRDEVHQGSVHPPRSLATSCSVLEATSFELVGDDLEGDYVQDSNQFLYGRPVFRHTENAAVIYWTEVEFGRRRLEEGREEDEDDGGGGGRGGGGVFEPGSLRKGQSARTAEARKAEYHLIGDHEGQEVESPAWFHGPLEIPPTHPLHPGAGGDVGTHAACLDGAWVVAPEDGTFPLYAVLDCARHPVDISGDDWYSSDCATCTLESTLVSFYFYCTALSSLYTPAPVVTRSPSATYSPAINLVPQIATMSPGAVVVVNNNSTCDSVLVSNSDDDGEYFAVGESVDGRFAWGRNSTTSTLIWTSGSVERRLQGRERDQDEQPGRIGASFDLRGWWRALRRREGRWRSPPLPKSDPGKSPLERAMGRILTEDNVVGRRTPDSGRNGEGLDPTGEALAMANAEGKAVMDSGSAGRCEDGYWELESESGTRIVALDCALHPADVTTFWYNVEGSSYWIDLSVRTPLMTVECPGEGSSSSSPSAGIGFRNAVPRVGEGDPEAPATETSGDSGSSSKVDFTVHVAIAIAAGLLVCLLACLGALYRVRRSQKQRHKFRIGRDLALDSNIAEIPLPASRASLTPQVAPLAVGEEEEAGRAVLVSGTSTGMVASSPILFTKAAQSSAEVTAGEGYTGVDVEHGDGGVKEEGSSDVKAEDGSREVNVEDSSKQAKAEHGSEEVGAEDGAEEVKAGDCSEEVNAEDGSKEAKAEDGSEEVRAENVSEEVNAEDGSKEVKAEDGSEAVKAEDGSEVVKAEDGSEAVKAEDDCEEVRAEDGAEEVRAEDGAEEVTAGDGSEEVKAEGG